MNDDSNEAAFDVCVVGGGISGLTAAYCLARRGARVILLEKQTQTGGVLQSYHEGGFTFDAGANTVRLDGAERSETFLRIVGELGIDNDLVFADESANKRYILRGGSLAPLPSGVRSFLQTPLLSWKAKFRIFGEPFIQARIVNDADNEESAADFFRRRFGEDPTRVLLNPMTRGIYGATPERLGVDAIFPKLCQWERQYGSVLRGIVAEQSRGSRGAKRLREMENNGDDKRVRGAKGVVNIRGGLHRLAEEMTRAIGKYEGCRVETGVAALSLRKTASAWRVETSQGSVTARACVLAADAHASASILTASLIEPPFARATEEAARSLANLEYSSLGLLHLAYKRASVQRALDGFGFLVPSAENEPFMGALWNSACFPSLAPENYATFTVFVEGALAPDLDSPIKPFAAMNAESAAARWIFERFQSIMTIRGEPEICRLTLWRRAIPLYAPGHRSREETWRALNDSPLGIYLLGNYSGGVSLTDCMQNASDLAARLVWRV